MWAKSLILGAGLWAMQVSRREPPSQPPGCHGFFPMLRQSVHKNVKNADAAGETRGETRCFLGVRVQNVADSPKEHKRGRNKGTR